MALTITYRFVTFLWNVPHDKCRAAGGDLFVSASKGGGGCLLRCRLGSPDAGPTILLGLWTLFLVNSASYQLDNDHSRGIPDTPPGFDEPRITALSFSKPSCQIAKHFGHDGFGS